MAEDAAAPAPTMEVDAAAAAPVVAAAPVEEVLTADAALQRVIRSVS